MWKILGHGDDQICVRKLRNPQEAVTLKLGTSMWSTWDGEAICNSLSQNLFPQRLGTVCRPCGRDDTETLRISGDTSGQCGSEIQGR